MRKRGHSNTLANAAVTNGVSGSHEMDAPAKSHEMDAPAESHEMEA
jgi:hypothetical protein